MGAEGSISLTFNSLTGAQAAALLAFAGGKPEALTAPVASVAAPVVEAAPAPVVPAPVAAPAPAAAPAPQATGVTLQNIVEAARAFATAPGKGGAAKLKEILGTFGAAKATEVDPARYAELHGALTA